VTAPTPANDLAALLAERDRVEAWLQALEGKRESTPPAVFQKVQRDYATRLETLTAQLRERDRELELRVAKLADELTAVEVHQRGKQDTRAEAELRHMVGEYTEEQWAAVAKESDAELAGIEARRVECARDHEAALALLASVRRPVATPAGATPRLSTPAAGAPAAPRASAQVPRAATPAAGTPAQRATPAAGAAAQPPRVTPAAASLAQPPRATPARGAAAVPPAVPPKATPVEPPHAVASPDRGEHIKTPSLDELAFLSSLAADVARRSGMSKAVSETQVNPPPAAPAPAPAPRPSRPVNVAEAKAADAAHRPSRPVTAAEAAPPAAPPAPEPRRTAPPSPAQEHLDAGVPPEHAALTDADVNVPRGSHTFATPATEQRAAAAPRVTSRDSASILRRAQAEHVKSLKCAECGTLNLPTEWYCEKCGAELSTL
jgi:hypothetical protein